MNKAVRMRLRVLLIRVALWCVPMAVHAAPNVQDAEDLYFQAKVPEAEQAFRTIVGDPRTSAADRAEASRQLARIDWHIDGDGPAALTELEHARVDGDQLCQTDQDTVRLLREIGRPRSAAAMARRSFGDCTGAGEKDALGLQAIPAELDLAAASRGRQRLLHLNRAAAMLAALSADKAFSDVAERARLELALQRSDAHTALEAWRGFYWLTDRSAPAGMAVEDRVVPGVFAAALRRKSDLTAQIALLRLLLRGGFSQEAQRWDATARIGARAARDPAYAPVAAYYRYRRALEPVMLDFNRKTARGKGDPAAYMTKVRSLIDALAQAVQPGAAKPEPVLKSAYGVYWTLGDTGGFASLHQGHIVDDQPLPVVQFDRKGEVGFISLGNMVSNGFQTWLWDGDASTGGWTTDDGVIVYVRDSYVSGPLEALNSLAPDALAKAAAKDAELRAKDLQALKARSVAYLPGLSRRLSEQAKQQVAVAAKSEAARLNKPFALVFVKLYWDATLQHSITVHEGRHALDKAEYGVGALSSPELEYRAKLSELELASYPRMALTNIMSSNIGDQTPHGVANARVVLGLRDWMAANSAQVAGLDSRVPLLEQLDRLTDDQIRTAAHGLDPHFVSRK